jgi:hypothetical protein
MGFIYATVILDVPASIHNEANVILNKFRRCKLTYVEAVSLVLINGEQIMI